MLRSTLLCSLIDEVTADFTMLDRLDETAPANVLGLFFVLSSAITSSDLAAATMLTDPSLLGITFYIYICIGCQCFGPCHPPIDEDYQTT